MTQRVSEHAHSAPFSSVKGCHLESGLSTAAFNQSIVETRGRGGAMLCGTSYITSPLQDALILVRVMRLLDWGFFLVYNTTIIANKNTLLAFIAYTLSRTDTC